MKRIICALLTVVMLAAMIPAFAVSTSAAVAPTYPKSGNVKIIPVSHTNNNNVNWSVIWTNHNVGVDSGNGSFVRLGADFTNEVEIIGKFYAPTEVTDIIFCSQWSHVRMNGVTVSLSNDCEDWQDVLTISGNAKKDESWFKLFEYEIDSNGVAYSYIKISQTTPNTLWGNKYTFDCPWVAVYGEEQHNSSDNPTGKINVTHVSATDTAYAWEKMWNRTNTTRLGGGLAAPSEFVGKFETPTKVTDVVMTVGKYPSRINGTTISFSVDGTNWDSAAVTVSGKSNKDATLGAQQYNFSVNADKEYSFVKVASTTTANSSGTYYFDIFSVGFYNNPYNVAEEDFETVYAVSQNSNLKVDASILWNYGNQSYIQYGNNANDRVMITGEFATPTVIENIFLKNRHGNGARSETIYVEASQDGQYWNQIAYSGAVVNTTSEVLLESNSSVPYKFIRIRENHGYTCGLMAVGVVGTAQTPATNETEADFYGVQVKKNTDDWALRLISTVDSLDFKAVGYEIKVTGNGVNKFFDEYTQTVYSSVVDNLGTRNAKALGGNYVFTASINGISIADYDELTFEIKPYVADENGHKTYGETQTYTFVDGVQK